MTEQTHETAQEWTYHLTDGETLLEGVVTAVSSASGRPPVSDTASGTDAAPLEPLYTAIDPDALESFYRATAQCPHTEGYLRFPYCGFEVCVRGDGTISVTEDE